MALFYALFQKRQKTRSKVNKGLKMNRKGFIRTASSLAVFPMMGNEWMISPNPTDRRFRPGHRILTCNIRVALPEDAEKGFGWPDRKEVCIEVIASQQPDIICLQEVLKEQMEDLVAA